MRKRRLFLLLPVSMLLLAACAHQPHHEYNGVAIMTHPPITDELWWDRTGSTANGTLTLGAGAGRQQAWRFPHKLTRPVRLSQQASIVSDHFTADTFAGVVSDTGGKEVAKATGTVTATGVDLTVAPPQKAPITISFKSTKEGAYTHSGED